jgi:trans-2,3-dihydro-3-hydroxyanthranilate isomerase
VTIPETSPDGYPYRVVDVFTDRPLEGNPLAVFPHALGLDDATMQNIARELNLSETVFVFPAARSGSAARIRIFTPSREMDFAGHPTIGASFVLLDEGIVPKHSASFVLEENIGPVPIRVEQGARPLIWLTTPPIEVGATFDRALCACALGLSPEDLAHPAPQRLSAGNPTIFVAVHNKEAVDRAWLDMSGMKKLKGTDQDPACVFVFAATPEGAYSRMFAPEHGIVEDPATGSSTGPLAAYMIRHNLVSGRAGNRFVSEQGSKMRRRSMLHVHLRGERGVDGIEVGGYVTPLVRAVMQLEIDGSREGTWES